MDYRSQNEQKPFRLVTLRIENNGLRELPETPTKRNKKTEGIPEEHLKNTFEQPRPANKNGRKRQRGMSDATVGKAQASSIGRPKCQASLVGPTEQRGTFSVGSTCGQLEAPPDAFAHGYPMPATSAQSTQIPVQTNQTLLNACEGVPVPIVFSTSPGNNFSGGLMNVSAAHVALGDRNSSSFLPTTYDDQTIVSQNDSWGVFPQLNNSMCSREPATPSDVLTSPTTPTSGNPSPCNHYAPKVLSYLCECGQTFYYETKTGTTTEFPSPLPECPVIQANAWQMSSNMASLPATDNPRNAHLFPTVSHSTTGFNDLIGLLTPSDVPYDPQYEYQNQAVPISNVGEERQTQPELHINTSVQARVDAMQSAPPLFNYSYSQEFFT